MFYWCKAILFVCCFGDYTAHGLIVLPVLLSLLGPTTRMHGTENEHDDAKETSKKEEEASDVYHLMET